MQIHVVDDREYFVSRVFVFHNNLRARNLLGQLTPQKASFRYVWGVL